MPDDIILRTVRWHIKAGIAYRKLVDNLSVRGIRVNKSTVFTWVQRFKSLVEDAPLLELDTQNEVGTISEAYCKLQERQVYLYRALDRHRQLLDIFVTEQPNVAGASAFFSSVLPHVRFDQEVTKHQEASIPDGRKRKPKNDMTAEQTKEGETTEVSLVEAAEAYVKRGQLYEQKANKILRKDKTTLVIAGYGASIRVERDALVVNEGHTQNPQTPLTHVLQKGLHAVERIICLDCKGAVSFDALRWSASQGVAISLLDRHGNLVSELTPEAESNIALRRQQYMCSPEQRVVIATRIVIAKLREQVATLAAHPEIPGSVLAQQELASFIQELEMLPEGIIDVAIPRILEGRAAAVYWNTWNGMPIRWKSRDHKKVPPHWLIMRERASPLSNYRNRHAVDPMNAILNYAYAILEGQCRSALLSIGFDISCGFLHADRNGRDSLIYDMMEPLRSIVDDRVLKFIQASVFEYGDFIKSDDGACRLHPQFARYMLSFCRLQLKNVIDYSYILYI